MDEAKALKKTNKFLAIGIIAGLLIGLLFFSSARQAWPACTYSITPTLSVRNLANNQLIYNGTDMSASISFALNLGGAVCLPAGSFPIKSTICIPSNEYLVGAGVNSTIFLAQSGLNGAVITNCKGNQGDANSGVGFLRIDGTQDPNKDSGIIWYDNSQGTWSSWSLDVESILINNMKGDGLVFNPGLQGHGWNLVQNSRFVNNIGIGLKQTAPDSQIRNVYASGNVSLYISGGTDSVSGGYFGGSYNLKGQVWLVGALGTNFQNTIIDYSSGPDLYVTNSYSFPTRNVSFIGGQLSNPSISTNSGYPTINVATTYFSSSNVAVQGLSFQNTKFFSTNPNLPSTLISTDAGGSGIQFLSTPITIQSFAGPPFSSQIPPNAVTACNIAGITTAGNCNIY